MVFFGRIRHLGVDFDSLKKKLAPLPPPLSHGLQHCTHLHKVKWSTKELGVHYFSLNLSIQFFPSRALTVLSVGPACSLGLDLTHVV